jgi:hypothetical protein
MKRGRPADNRGKRKPRRHRDDCGFALYGPPAVCTCRLKLEIPKATGARLDGGKLSYRRSKAHLDLVRAQPCLVSRRLGPGVVAHHPDEVVPDLIKQGGKISDFLAVPLFHELHDPGHPGALHKTNSASWWEERGVRPLAWLLSFLQRHYKPGQSAGADEAVIAIRRRIAMNEAQP